MNWKMLLVSVLLIGTLAGCGTDNDEATDEQNNDTTQTEEESTDTAQNDEEAAEEGENTDALTTASIVNEPDAFVKAVSENGNWIVAILEDLTVDQDVVVAGEFHDKNDAAKDVYRKLALYSQDEDHNITDSFTLTVPKMTVQSPNFKIEGGTVKGDVYVEAEGFNLAPTAKINGNIFYANEDVKASAKIEGDVSGTQEVQG